MSISQKQLLEAMQREGRARPSAASACRPRLGSRPKRDLTRVAFVLWQAAVLLLCAMIALFG